MGVIYDMDTIKIILLPLYEFSYIPKRMGYVP